MMDNSIDSCPYVPSLTRLFLWYDDPGWGHLCQTDTFLVLLLLWVAGIFNYKICSTFFFCRFFILEASSFAWCKCLLLRIAEKKDNSLPTGFLFWWPFQTAYIQIRPDKMSGLIWIQTVWHSDGISEIFFPKS